MSRSRGRGRHLLRRRRARKQGSAGGAGNLPARLGDEERAVLAGTVEVEEHAALGPADGVVRGQGSVEVGRAERVNRDGAVRRGPGDLAGLQGGLGREYSRPGQREPCGLRAGSVVVDARAYSDFRYSRSSLFSDVVSRV